MGVLHGYATVNDTPAIIALLDASGRKRLATPPLGKVKNTPGQSATETEALSLPQSHRSAAASHHTYGRMAERFNVLILG